DAKDRVGTATNLFAAKGRFEAAGDIGALGAGTDNALDLYVHTVTARTTVEGSINLFSAWTIVVNTVDAITVQPVAADASTADRATIVQEDLTTAGNGHIILRAAAGSIGLYDGSNNPDNIAVSAHGTGRVLIENAG